MDKTIKALKELGQFFGKKIDELKSSFDLSENNRRLEQIKDVILTQTTDLARAYPNEKDLNKLSEAAKQLQSATETLKSQTELTVLSETLEKISNDNNDNIISLTDKQQELANVILEQTGILSKILNKKQETADTTKINKLLLEIKTTIKGLKFEQKEINFEPLNTTIKTIPKLFGEQMVVSNNSVIETINSKFVSLEDIIEKAIKQLKSTGVVKLDEMQLRALKPQGGYGGILPARTTKITNVVMTGANTEYSHTFNKSCVSFRMKLRAGNAKFNYSWESGTLAVSGDASSYISIPASWLDSREGVEYGEKTVYFESSVASQIMEVEENIA